MLEEFRTWYNHDRPHRALGGATPAQAYTALPKATPHTITEPEWRTRIDRVDKNGKISLRCAGKLRHLGVGRAWIGAPVLLLIHDQQATTSHAHTGEVLAEHLIDETKDYQASRR